MLGLPGMRGCLPGQQLSAGFHLRWRKTAGVAPAAGGSRSLFHRLGGGQPNWPLALGNPSGNFQELLPHGRSDGASVRSGGGQTVGRAVSTDWEMSLFSYHGQVWRFKHKNGTVAADI